MKFIAIIILCIFPSYALAQSCPRTLIQKGTAAPCSGYILSPEAIEEATKLPKQITLLEDKLKFKDEHIEFRDQKIKLLTDSNSTKDDTINKMHTIILDKDKNETLKIGLIIGGSVLATALVAIGIAFAMSSALKLEIKQGI